MYVLGLPRPTQTPNTKQDSQVLLQETGHKNDINSIPAPHHLRPSVAAQVRAIELGLLFFRFLSFVFSLSNRTDKFWGAKSNRPKHKSGSANRRIWQWLALSSKPTRSRADVSRFSPLFTQRFWQEYVPVYICTYMYNFMTLSVCRFSVISIMR